MRKLFLFTALLGLLAIQTHAQKINYDGSAIVVTPENLGDTAVRLTFTNLPFPNGTLPNSYGFGRYFYESDKATACVGAQMSPMAYRPPNFYNECGASLCANEWFCFIQGSNYTLPQSFNSITVKYNQSVGNCGIATDGTTHTYRIQLTYLWYSGTSYKIYETAKLFQLTAPFVAGTSPCGATAPVLTPPDPVQDTKGNGAKKK